MKKLTTDDHRRILENRVALEAVEPPACPDKLPELVFALRQGEHVFSLDLETLLKCLKVAENQGHLPPIDLQWWLAVSYRYNTGLME